MQISFDIAMSKRKPADGDRDRSLELISLGRASYASKSAIASLLAVIDAEGLPETYSRTAQYRARKDICRERAGQYGPLVVDVQLPLDQSSGGGSQKFSMQNVFAFLEHHCKNSPHYAHLMQAALKKYPCSPSSPWRLILYQDGVDPSDGLSVNHSRKSSVFYWSFVELGMKALSKEEVWGVICTARYTEYTKLAGKGASLFEAVLNQFFGQVHDIRRSGCSLSFPDGERAMLFADANVLLADLPALAECIHCKTHAGTMCCPGCSNATLETSVAAVQLHEMTNAVTSISSTEWSDFTKHTNESVRRVVQRLNQRYQDYIDEKITKEKFEDVQQALGWNWNPSSVILNPRFNLKIADMLMFDAAHVYVHDGLADAELGQMMKVFFSNHSLTSFAELGQYVSTFTFPKATPKLDHLFRPAANLNNSRKGTFACTGSEFLTLAPVLKRYVGNVIIPRGQFVAHAESMLAVLKVVELLQALKTGTVDHGDLHEAIVEHLRLYKSCYGSKKMRPKHHYALHLPDMLRRHGFLLMTFTHERKHRLVTRYTRDRKNLRNWDSGAIEEITCHQIWENAQPFFMAYQSSQVRGNMLVPLRELFPGVADTQFSFLNSTHGNGGAINAGDVVSVVVNGQTMLGELIMSVGINRPPKNEAYCIVSLWQHDPASAHIAWRRYTVSRDNIVVQPLTSLDTVFTYRMSADRRSAQVYMPLEVRPR